MCFFLATCTLLAALADITLGFYDIVERKCTNFTLTTWRGSCAIVSERRALQRIGKHACNQNPAWRTNNLDKVEDGESTLLRVGTVNVTSRK